MEKNATLVIKNYQVLLSLSFSDKKNYLRDEPFSTDIEIVNLHSSKGTHWVAYIKENCFDC